MWMEEFIFLIVKFFVDYLEDVVIMLEEMDILLIYKLFVSKEDMGCVIGK